MFGRVSNVMENRYLFPCLLLLCSLVEIVRGWLSWEGGFYPDRPHWLFLSATFFLALTYGACRYFHTPRVELGKMWQLAAVALVICLLHRGGMQQALLYPAVFMMTYACLCLLWAVMGKWSLVILAPFVLIEAIQAYMLRVYAVEINSFVLVEAFSSSEAEMLPFVTGDNILALILFLIATAALMWVYVRIVSTCARRSLLMQGSAFCFFSMVLAWVGAPLDNKKPSQHLWPISECMRLGSVVSNTFNLKSDLISFVGRLPSPALEPASCHTVGAHSGVVVVLHVGESVRADSMSINGYGRKTTPWLESNPDVINFPDCISSWYATMPAQTVMLTNARRHVLIAPADKQATCGSFIDLFHKLGFDIHSFMGKAAGISKDFAKHNRQLVKDAQSVSYAGEKPWDSVDQVAELLHKYESSGKGDRNLFLFVNNEGSHIPFSHYDREHPMFTPSRPDHAYAGAHAQEVRNAYDNTIYYTDVFWMKLCELLKGRPFVYIYMSDHGEYLGHDGIWTRGALAEETFDYHATTGCRVGAFVITSPEFRALHPHMAEAVEQLKAHTQMTVGHEHLFHTMLGLFDIKSPYYEAQLDLCSPLAQPYTGPQPATPAQRALPSAGEAPAAETPVQEAPAAPGAGSSEA